MSAWWKNFWLNTFDSANLHLNVPNSTMFTTLTVWDIATYHDRCPFVAISFTAAICRQYLPTSFLLFTIRISMTQLLHTSGCSGLPYFNQLQLFVSQSETTRLSPKSRVLFVVVQQKSLQIDSNFRASRRSTASRLEKYSQP